MISYRRKVTARWKEQSQPTPAGHAVQQCVCIMLRAATRICCCNILLLFIRLRCHHSARHNIHNFLIAWGQLSDGWMDGRMDACLVCYGWLLLLLIFPLIFFVAFSSFWGATLRQLDKAQHGISSNNHNFCASAWRWWWSAVSSCSARLEKIFLQPFPLVFRNRHESWRRNLITMLQDWSNRWAESNEGGSHHAKIFNSLENKWLPLSWLTRKCKRNHSEVLKFPEAKV